MTDEEALERVRELARVAELPSPPERKDIRSKAGLSGREFAEALGISPSTLCNWEKGLRNPKRKRALYAEALFILKQEQTT